MPHKISGVKFPSQILKYLVFLLLVNVIKYSSGEQFGKLITEGKLCTDLEVDDVKGDYTDLGTDVDIPVIYHHVKTPHIPYPHTLRIVVPIGSVIQFEAFAAMAIDQTGLSTGRFHSCIPSAVEEGKPKIVNGRCTVSKEDWQRTFMGYQDPLRIISTEKFSKAIEFFWSWVGDRPAPILLQFRFIGIEKTTRKARAKFYGVLASPVLETTNAFQQTPPISVNEINNIKCFEVAELKPDDSNTSTASDHFTYAAGFAPQQQMPLNQEYLKLIKDNIDEYAKRAATTEGMEESITKATTKKTTTIKMVHMRHKGHRFHGLHLINSNKKSAIAEDESRQKLRNLKGKQQERTTTATTTTTTDLTTKLIETTSKAKTNYDDIPSTITLVHVNNVKSTIDEYNPELILKDNMPYDDDLSNTIQNSRYSMFQLQKNNLKSSRKVDNRPIYKPLRSDVFPEQKNGPKSKIKLLEPERTHLNVTVDDENVVTESSKWHAISMLYIWFVCIPNAFFINRYFKESHNIKICGGKSLSFILHVLLLVNAFTLIVVSASFSFLDFFTRETAINLQQPDEIRIHIYLGIISSVLFGALVLFGWLTCKQNSRQCINASFHFFAGNTSYILALIMIWRSYYIGMPCATWIIAMLWIAWTLSANAIMCSHFYWQDKTVGFKNYFRAFVPMPITAVIEAPDIILKERILWWHFGGSWIAFTFISLLYSIKDVKCANCQFEFVLGCMPKDH